MNEQYTKIERRGMSPWTALILGLAGIIIAAIVVGGLVANKGLDKFGDTGIEILGDLESGPTQSDAKNFTNANWPDLIAVPTCPQEEEACPHLVVGVAKKQSDRTGKMTYYITAEIIGGGDDSNAGYGREARVKFENGTWVYALPGDYSYTDFKLCRNLVRYPKDAICP